MLDWLVRRHDTSPACLKVERRYVDEDVGYCLVATADIESEEVCFSCTATAGSDQQLHLSCLHGCTHAPACPSRVVSHAGVQVILSVPLTAGITSEGVDESKWSTHMALQLLRLQAQAADAAAAGDAAALATSVQPWLDALPAHVDLPWLYWSEEEMAELQDEDTVAEAQQLRAVYEDACQVSVVATHSMASGRVLGLLWEAGVYAGCVAHVHQPEPCVRPASSPPAGGGGAVQPAAGGLGAVPGAQPQLCDGWVARVGARHRPVQPHPAAQCRH